MRVKDLLKPESPKMVRFLLLHAVAGTNYNGLKPTSNVGKLLNIDTLGTQNNISMEMYIK